MPEYDLSINMIQELYNVTWNLMDFSRDKRYKYQHDKPTKPRKGIPQEDLQALVDANHTFGRILQIYNKPDLDIDEKDIPETVVAEIDLTKED